MVRDAKSTDRVAHGQKANKNSRRKMNKVSSSSRSKRVSAWYTPYLAVLELQPWYGTLECIAFGTLLPSVSSAVRLSRTRGSEEDKPKSECRGALVLTSHMLYAVLFIDTLHGSVKPNEIHTDRNSSRVRPSFAVLVEEMAESFVSLHAIRVVSDSGSNNANNESNSDLSSSSDCRNGSLILSLATWDRHCCLGDDLVFCMGPNDRSLPSPVVFFSNSDATSQKDSEPWERRSLELLESILRIECVVSTDVEWLEGEGEHTAHDENTNNNNSDNSSQRVLTASNWPFDRLPLQLVNVGGVNESNGDDEDNGDGGNEESDEEDDNSDSDNENENASSIQIFALTNTQQKTAMENEEERFRHGLILDEGREFLEVWSMHVSALQEMWANFPVAPIQGKDSKGTTTSADGSAKNDGDESDAKRKAEADAEARAQIRTNIAERSVTLASSKGMDHLPPDDPYRRRHETAISTSGLEQLDAEGIQQAKRILEEEEKNVRIKMHRFLAATRGN